MSKTVITAFSNLTLQGVTLHTNVPTKLKTGNIKADQFYVSWDKIGALLFQDYAEGSVPELNELRADNPSKDKANGK